MDNRLSRLANYVLSGFTSRRDAVGSLPSVENSVDGDLLQDTTSLEADVASDAGFQITDADGAGDAPGGLRASIESIRNRLIEIIEPDFGLLDQLYCAQVLTLQQRADIRSERTVYRRNDALLDCLKSKEQCRKFLDALRHTEQAHVASYIEKETGTECGDVRPLDEARMRLLTLNGVHLLDRIDPNIVFVTELATAGCITWPQREHIVNILQPRDRNDKLLEFLTRRSVADLNKFTEVLAKQQPHLVQILATNGVVVGMNAKLDDLSVNDVSQAENRIVSQFVELSAKTKQEIQAELDDMLRPYGVYARLVLLEKDNSIALLFICETIGVLTRLRDQWLGGQLHLAVEALFTRMSNATETACVNRLSWSQTDYQRCAKYFAADKKTMCDELIKKNNELAALVDQKLGKRWRLMGTMAFLGGYAGVALGGVAATAAAAGAVATGGVAPMAAAAVGEAAVVTGAAATAGAAVGAAAAAVGATVAGIMGSRGVERVPALGFEEDVQWLIDEHNGMTRHLMEMLKNEPLRNTRVELQTIGVDSDVPAEGTSASPTIQLLRFPHDVGAISYDNARRLRRAIDHNMNSLSSVLSAMDD